MLIYKATNTINGKVYIGLTTKTLSERVAIHLRDSNKLDTYFYRAIRKYGFSNFSWEVIDTAKTKQELELKEKMWIKHYGSFDNKALGYNTQSGGSSLYEITQKERVSRSERMRGIKNPMYGKPSPNSGKKFSQSHKDKISQSLKNKPRPSTVGGNNHNAKAVQNLNTLEIFTSITEAAFKYDCTRTLIGRACRNGGKAKGCYWKYC